MIQLLWKQFRYKLGSTILFVLALVSIMIVLPMSLMAIFNANEQVESDVTHYARGSYDILVRDVDNKHPLEEELGIVPENYIGFGNGGISIEQWEQIKNDPDVDVAAPVASLGYFTGMNSNTGIDMVDGSARYSVEYATTDGVNNYAIDEKILECILLEPSGDLPSDLQLKEELISDISLINYCYNAVQFQMPTTYQLLVAIDPEEEEQLTGVDFDLNNFGWGNTTGREYGLDNSNIVPVLEINSTGPSLIGNYEIDELPVDAEKTKEYREYAGLPDHESDTEPDRIIQLFPSEGYGDEVYNEIYEDIKQLEPIKSHHLTIDFSEHLRGFFHEGHMVRLDGSVELMEPGIEGRYVVSLDLGHTTNYFTAGYPEYEKVDGQYYIPKVDEHDGVPVYRETVEHGFYLYDKMQEGNEDEVNYILDPIQSVSIDSGSLELSSSPMGIYQFTPVYHIDEENDEKTLMSPTITPGSFVSSPAGGVTHIDYVDIFKNDSSPIDAIRVRVAGIDSYDEAAKKKIDEVSQRIEEMGLDVAIVAGASPQLISMEVEDVGLVEEAWTTLGAAGEILSFWHLLSIILSSLFFIVMVLYVYNRFSFWQVSKQGELKLLEQLGWSKRHIYRLSMLEILLLLIISVLVSFVGVSILGSVLAFEQSLYGWLFIGIVIVTTVILLLSYFKLFKFTSHHQTLKGNQRNRRTRNIQSYVLKNLMFFKGFITPSFVQLLIASYLSVFVLLVINKTQSETNVTLLGQHINLQTEDWQYILLLSIFILAIVTIIESLISLVKQRTYEFKTLWTVGWEYKQILKMYVKESLLWSSVAIIIGLILSTLTYQLFYSVDAESIKIILFSGMLLLFVIIVLVLVTLHVLIRRINN